MCRAEPARLRCVARVPPSGSSRPSARAAHRARSWWCRCPLIPSSVRSCLDGHHRCGATLPAINHPPAEGARQRNLQRATSFRPVCPDASTSKGAQPRRDWCWLGCVQRARAADRLLRAMVIVTATIRLAGAACRGARRWLHVAARRAGAARRGPVRRDRLVDDEPEDVLNGGELDADTGFPTGVVGSVFGGGDGVE